MSRPPKLRYQPRPVADTSGHDYLSYEVQERLPEHGYGSRPAAERGWYRACKAINERRRVLGYRPVSWPLG